MRLTLKTLLGGVALALGMTATLAPAGPRIVSFFDDDAPGTFDRFDTYSAPVLNDRGEAAFWGRAGQTDGLWRETAGGLTDVTLEDQLVDGATVAPLQSAPLLNNAGHIAHFNGSRPAGTLGVISTAGGSPAKPSQLGDSLPTGGPAGGSYGWGYDGARLNQRGQLSLFAGITGDGFSSGDHAITRYEPGGASETLAYTGMAAPGERPGTGFADLYAPQLNSSGDLLFGASLGGPGGSSLNDSSLWRHRDGGMERLVREADQIPGMRRGVQFGNFYGYSINDSGQASFVSEIKLNSGLEVYSTNDSAVWIETDGTLDMIAREGDLAPGMSGGQRLHSLDHTRLSSSGHVGFFANTRNEEGRFQSGIFRGDATQVELVIGEGDAVPGVGAGATFDHYSPDWAMNADGSMAIETHYYRADGSWNRGLWLSEAGGDLELITHVGGVIEVGPGDLRTVDDFKFLGGGADDDGGSTGFNNLGQVAFYASFVEGGSGLFVTGGTALIPEPTSVAALASLLAIAGGFCRRNG